MSGMAPRKTKTIITVFAFLVLCTMVTACQGLRRAPEALPSPDLAARVGDYLRADERKAVQQLADLSSHSAAELESALRYVLGRSFPKRPPIGHRPGQTVRLGPNLAQYGLYVPASYRPSRAFPLIICLHGAGFTGDSYLDRWQPRLGEEYILACPTIEGGAWWSSQGEALVQAVLLEVGRNYHIDTDRVYLTGMSNGGIGTLLIGLNHPDLFAALAPMAASFSSTLFPLLDNALNLPFYLIHGSADQVMPVRFSRDVAGYLKRKNYEVVYREHDWTHPHAGGHFFPKEELPGLLAWIKDKKRRAWPRQVTLVRDRDHRDRAYWIRIDEIAPGTGSFWASEYYKEEEDLLAQGAYARLTASINGNVVSVTTENILQYSLLISRELLDWNKPVMVVTNGRVSFERLIEPDGRALLQEARRRPDPRQLVLATVKITVPPPTHTPFPK